MSPESSIAHYRITAKLGEGGMGEVWRATDTKLGREVAIKILPEAFAQDADRMARFTREAQVLASLNHPNIAAIYGVEERALVMELVEGKNLSGPLPLETALSYARQIADALEAAHEKGVVHRDLKPANIQVKPDGAVKVLDFGLAKSAEQSSGDSQNSPTLTISPTRVGMIMGTAGYMSPEQAAGKPVDKRSDIWSFGVVLWEMLTGHRLFEGETISHTLADVLREPIDLARLPSDTPPAIRTLLGRCLERDVKKRLRDIGEARIVLENPPAPAPAAPRARPWLPWGVDAVLFVCAVAIGFIHFREKPPAADVVRFEIGPPRNGRFTCCLSISPDGRKVAFTAGGGTDSRPRLWIRAVDTVEARSVYPSLTGNSFPSSFWSADSRFLAFNGGGKLRKVEASGGPPQTICDTPPGFTGGAWSPDGAIVVDGAAGLMRVPAAGGDPSPLTRLDPSRQESAHRGPALLPDGRHFVYLRVSAEAEKSGIYLGSLDAKPEQQGSKRLLATDSSAAYATSPDPALGYLLFERAGTLMAQAFDARRLELAGDAVPIAEGLAYIGVPQFSVSTTGVLIYRIGDVTTPEYSQQLTWFDRAGKILQTVGEPGQYTTVSLSPDGARVAFDHRDPQAAGTGLAFRRGNTDIWLHEFSRGASTRLTSDPAFDVMPVWSPDGSRIIFASNRDGVYNLYRKVSNGAEDEGVLLKSNEGKFPYDWSRDGRFLLYGVANKVWVLPLTGDDQKAMPYLQTESSASQARFSPDSRWIAYSSDESGKSEVYVRPFPAASGGKWTISKGGGNQPRWRRDGKELFYVSPDGKMMSVGVATPSGTFQAGIPKALFAAPILGAASSAFVYNTRYDVTADGQKFLINAVSTETASAPQSAITVVLNWQAGLKK